MSLLVFAALYLIGNPIDMLVSPNADQLERARVAAAFGLDQPFMTQYWKFLVHWMHGDLGNSFAYSTPALSLIIERMPATLELSLTAIVLAVLIGIPLGLLSGLRPGSWLGKSIMFGSIIGFSLPTFWVGLVMILLFSVHFGWLPTGGRGATHVLWGVQFSIFTLDGWRHLILPALNLALFNIALVIRLARSGTQEAMLQEYVRFARAKGLRERRIIGVHVLKNILIPIITVIGLQFGSIVAFSIVTETIFAWPGMGKLMIDSVRILDRPVVVAYLMLIVSLFLLINLIVDVLYAVLDPRVRLANQKG
jgi:peptide/nickel transport system permease protein